MEDHLRIINVVKPRWTTYRCKLTLMLVGFFFACFCRAEDPNKLPKPTTYVNDFAGVIDASSEESLNTLSRQVYEKAHATLLVVTIKSLDGLDIESFTTQLEANWHAGAKGTDKGVIMVFAIQDRKRRIEVGYGLEGILNDAKVGDIGRSMVPELRGGQYGPAALTGARQIAAAIAQDANVTLDAPVHTYHREAAPQHHGFPFGILIFLFILIFVISRAGRGGGGPYGGGGGGGGWLTGLLIGSLLNGGRGGGGGSGWSGGGGDSGGGGGGDFGGGFGGDSGGGGASGDW